MKETVVKDYLDWVEKNRDRNPIPLDVYYPFYGYERFPFDTKPWKFHLLIPFGDEINLHYESFFVHFFGPSLSIKEGDGIVPLDRFCPRPSYV